MSEKSKESDIPSLVYRVIFGLCERNKDEAVRHFNTFLHRLLPENSIDSIDECDEFAVIEDLKRIVLSKHGEGEANTAGDLCRKLQGITILSSRKNILSFFTKLSLQGSNLNLTACSSRSDFNSALVKNVTFRHSSRNLTTHLKLNTNGPSTSNSSTPSATVNTSLPARQLNLFSRSSTDLQTTGYDQYSHDLPRGTIAHLSGRPFVIPFSTVNPCKSSVSEVVLLKELIYCFQGIGGTILKLDPITQGFAIDSKVELHVSSQRKVLRLAEIGWLHNQVRQHCDAPRPTGLMSQSLIAALHEELTEYYRLIACLQSRLQQNSDIVDSPLSEEQVPLLTLCQLSLYMMSPLERLQLLLSVVKACQGKRGGALASCVHSFLQHGAPRVRRTVRMLLTAVCRPMYVMLSRWILDGELEDPHSEFFIAANPEVKGDRLWHDKYYVQESLVPSFISLAQARKILATGKNINFLREVCQNHTPIKGREALKQALESTNVEALFVEDHDGELQNMLEQAYRETSRRVLDVLNNNYKFFDHLQALRRYLLLGQGDFIRHLMELLEPELLKPATEMYPHNLSGILESAIRSTNAQFEDENILNRLDVRVLEKSPGDTGWDVFTLDYHVSGPIGTIFEMNMTSYLMLFNALWRAKRMEFALSRALKRQLTAAKQMRCLPEMTQILQRSHLLVAEMVHFVHQVQYYTLFEVLECSWHAFIKQVQQAEGLDDVIKAHSGFLTTVRAGAFLDDGSKELAAQLRSVYDLMLQFQTLEDQLYARAAQELEARQIHERLVEVKGTSTAVEEKEAARVKDFKNTYLPHMKTQLNVLAKGYQDMVKKFLLMLTSQPELTLQLLSFRLDFNEFYRRSDSRLNAPLTYQHRRLSELGIKQVVPTRIK